ncbi:MULTISPECIES: DUF2637 domain-containing protein [Mycobacteriaceae]|uniref:DUF2637 domain-containing protein n=1 Tax=Mycolicibacterium lutetiense TaxID=1641992 RepID=A0ABS4ZRR2_9MYCO|nr:MULTISPECIES: DUF2637 domain-containing protein [Mycobacteriaceae]MBP2451891.1 hypothetical protein [Mycolicibacterium lutetiense]
MTPYEIHTRVRRLLWALLAFATTASLSGNVARTVITHSGAAAVGPIVAAALAPFALLSLTHLLGLWSHIAARGPTYWCFLVAIIALSATAFRLSFDALRSLAIEYGYTANEAALFPVMIDGIIAVCTLGLVVLTRIEIAAMAHQSAAADATNDAPDAARHRISRLRGCITTAVHRFNRSGPVTQARPAVMQRNDAREAPVDATHREATPAITRDGAHQNQTRATLPPPGLEAPISASSLSTSEPAATSGSDQTNRPQPGSSTYPAPRRSQLSRSKHAALAHQLFDSKRVAAAPDMICAVLDHNAEKKPSREIAAELGTSPSKVQRILRAAREVQQSGLD